ncbi:MAG: pectin methylesterase [Lachnospiraceae bacterium]|nr:pectin methylesterase [Lachnospiraceae bacterium]
MITISKDDSGDYTSITEALSNVTATPETIYIRNGIYEECVEVLKPNLTFIGEDVNKTVITFGNYANMLMNDGSLRRTFRTYTFLVNTNNFTAKNITFINSAGSGSNIGQAIAVYNEGDRIHYENCKMLGHQDTLFTGPLPPKEIEPGGFIGPTQYSKREHGRHLYSNCYIEGDVDFIFGSATAYFDNCRIHSISKNEAINGYVAAPSTPEGQDFGYVFNECTFTSNCEDGTVYLARPWRNFAKAVFLNCDIGPHINKAGFDDWNKSEAHKTMFFAEYNSKGQGANNEARATYAKLLSDEDAMKYTIENVLKKQN